MHSPRCEVVVDQYDYSKDMVDNNISDCETLQDISQRINRSKELISTPTVVEVTPSLLDDLKNKMLENTFKQK